ncbi:MAG: alpha/beta fold hydrolase [Cyanobacteria bacterium P01_D01_bin.56]
MMVLQPNSPELVILSQASDRLPILVFLSGMDGSLLSLQNHFESLATTFDVRCFCIPGHDATSWASLVRAVAEPLRAEKESRPQRPIYLCGESFGGCLALETVSHYPGLFDRLILINPASSFNRRLWRSLGSRILRWMPGTTYRVGAMGLMPFMIKAHRVTNHNRQALLQAMQLVTPEAIAWRLSLLRDFRLNQAKLRRFKSPTLVVAATADRLLPSVSEAKSLEKQLQRAQVTYLHGSGHACLLERDISLHKILQQANFLPAVEPAIVG